MPRTKEQYEAMRTVTREKIHSAAIKLFTQKGVAATSVQDIADSAGISTGLMYRHYKSKEALFSALVSKATDRFADLVRKFQSDVSPINFIRKLTLEIINAIAKGDEFAEYLSLMNRAFMMEDPPSQVQYVIEQNAAILKQTAQIIEKGQALGQFKQGNVLEMTFYYFAIVQGLVTMKFTMKEMFIAPRPEIVTAFLIKE